MAQALRKSQLGLAIPFTPKTPLRKKIGWHIGQEGVHATLLEITPDDAADLLQRNQGDVFRNRAESDTTVAKYVRDMRRGWRLTGETIILSKTGRLLNGQHRLRACIEAGVPFATLVAFGVEEDVFAFMDRGKQRTSADIFSIHNVGDYVKMASAALWVWKYYNTGMLNPVAAASPPPDVLYGFYSTYHPGLDGSGRVGAWVVKAKLGTPSLWTALHYLCGHISGDVPAADAYFHKLATGDDVKRHEAAFRIREKLLDARLDGQALHRLFEAAAIVIGWNATREKRRLTAAAMRWRSEQDRDQPFPIISA